MKVKIDDSTSRSGEFAGITQISAEADDLVTRVIGESKVTSNGRLVGSQPTDYSAPQFRSFSRKTYIPLRKWEGTHSYCMEATLRFSRGLGRRDALKFDRTDPCVTYTGGPRPQPQLWPTVSIFSTEGMYRGCNFGGGFIGFGF